MANQTKVCFTCKVEKPLSEFHRDKNRYKPDCKPCRSERRKSYSNGRVGRQAEAAAHLQARYGITPEIWMSMFKEQNGKCWICQEETGQFHVDHCHKTKKVRGLLCKKCNLALGLLKDDADNLRRAIDYLGRHGD